MVGNFLSDDNVKNLLFAIHLAFNFVLFSESALSQRQDIYVSQALIVVTQQRQHDLYKNCSFLKTSMEDTTELLLTRMLTEPVLSKIVRKFDVYPELVIRGDISPCVERLKQSIKISQGNKFIKEASNTLEFRVSFEYKDPKIAYQVTKAIVNLIIENSVLDLRLKVMKQEDFLDTELSTIRKALGELETALAEFKQSHHAELPDSLTTGLAKELEEKEVSGGKSSATTATTNAVELELKNLGMNKASLEFVRLIREYYRKRSYYFSVQKEREDLDRCLHWVKLADSSYEVVDPPQLGRQIGSEGDFSSVAEKTGEESARP